MSAPSIPNLLSLRTARGGGGGLRGARRGQGRGGPAAAKLSSQAVILGTDNDAAVSRLSAVDSGYLDDPYARFFVRSGSGQPQRRLPIINRGTYTRTSALDMLIDSFLSPAPAGPAETKQIVSLGAGTDTRALRLFASKRGDGLIYHEIDFAETCLDKFRTVQGVPVLSEILTNLSRHENGSWSSETEGGGQYFCHGFDLRELSPTTAKPVTGLRTDVPTLLISECCLCYMAPSDASDILSFFTKRIPTLATIIYEPTRPNDAFGKVMTTNLAARHIAMPTLERYPEPADQVQRLRDAGFGVARQMTIGDIWDRWVRPEEKQRVDRLEGLDEVEEWKLLADHYIVAWGSTVPGQDLWGGSSE